MERQLKPYQILIYLGATYALLAIIVLIFPSGGIKISDELTLKFVTFDELINPKIVDYKDISDVTQNKALTDVYESCGTDVFSHLEDDCAFWENHGTDDDDMGDCSCEGPE